MAKVKRMQGTQRKEHILQAALTQAGRIGFQFLTRDGVAEEAGIAIGLVSHYYNPFDSLKKEVMQRAVRENRKSIVADGLLYNDPVALAAPTMIKEGALEWINSQ